LGNSSKVANLIESVIDSKGQNLINNLCGALSKELTANVLPQLVEQLKSAADGLTVTVTIKVTRGAQ
jgi:F0F1-type ATP synthase delta subunit